MLFASSGQINAQLPYEVDGNVTLVLHTPGGVSDSFHLQISATAPGVFRSGVAGPLTGVATVVRASNSMLVTPSNPIHRGDTVVIYLTGLGRTWPAVDTGSPAPFDPLAFAQVQPSVTLGGQVATVEYAGLTPGLVGVYQINVRVPDYAPTGLEVPLAIIQGGNSTTIPVRLVQ